MRRRFALPVARMVLLAAFVGLEENVGKWRSRRASADLSIFPAVTPVNPALTQGTLILVTWGHATCVARPQAMRCFSSW